MMLTKIRNANLCGKSKVDVKASKLNKGVLDILKRENFIQNYKDMPEAKYGLIRVYLKFDEEGRPALQGLKKISRPGLKVYSKAKEIKSVLGGLGMSIISTSQGLMTDTQAREKKIGGELLCRIW